MSNNRGDSIMIGGPGDDTMIGGDDKDIFIYRANDYGNDVIINFQVDDGDVIDLSDLLSYKQGDNVSDFIKVMPVQYFAIEIDANGDGSGTDVRIVLDLDTDYFNLDVMIAEGSIVLY